MHVEKPRYRVLGLYQRLHCFPPLLVATVSNRCMLGRNDVFVEMTTSLCYGAAILSKDKLLRICQNFGADFYYFMQCPLLSVFDMF